MRADVLAPKPHPVMAPWMSRKFVRLAVLLSVLLAPSAAVNGLIILASATP